MAGCGVAVKLDEDQDVDAGGFQRGEDTVLGCLPGLGQENQEVGRG